MSKLVARKRYLNKHAYMHTKTAVLHIIQNSGITAVVFLTSPKYTLKVKSLDAATPRNIHTCIMFQWISKEITKITLNNVADRTEQTEQTM